MVENRLPMRETPAWSLTQEDPTYQGATKHMYHNYWVCALEPEEPQLLSAWTLELTPRSRRSHLQREAQRLQWRVALIRWYKRKALTARPTTTASLDCCSLFQKLYSLIWGLKFTLLHCDSYAIIFTKQFIMWNLRDNAIYNIACIFSNFPGYWVLFHIFPWIF